MAFLVGGAALEGGKDVAMWCVKARKLDEDGFVSNAELGDDESTMFSY